MLTYTFILFQPCVVFTEYILKSVRHFNVLNIFIFAMFENPLVNKNTASNMFKNEHFIRLHSIQKSTGTFSASDVIKWSP